MEPLNLPSLEVRVENGEPNGNGDEQFTKRRTRRGFVLHVITILLLLGFVSQANSGQIISTSSHSEEISAVPTLTWAVIGSKVALPCDVTIPSSEDSISLILWYKNDRKSAPIYSIDARNIPIELAKHFISDSLRDRAKFELSTRPQALLHIDPVMADDAGIYFCRVDFKWARTINTISNLSVIVSPQVNIVIAKTSRPKQQQSNGSFMGSKVTDPGHHQSSSSREDESGDNEDDEEEPDLSRMMARRRGVVHEGTEAVIECRIKANPPVTSIHWFFNQRPISNDFPLPVPGIRLSDNSTRLIIPSVTKRHEGMYKCSAVNIGGTGESADFKVIVLYPPEIDLVLRGDRDDRLDKDGGQHRTGQRSGSIKTLKEGEEVVMDCRINSNPVVNQINWFMNNNALPLSTDPVKGIIISNSTLIIKNIRRDFHGGNFKCAASNSEGRRQSHEASLSILYPPGIHLVFRDSDNQESGQQQQHHGYSQPRTENVRAVKEGEEVVLDCRVNSNPIVSQINWFMNNGPLTTDPVKGIIISNSTLIIKYVRRDVHRGNFKCSAMNTEGRGQSNEVMLSILHAPICDIVVKDNLESQLSPSSSLSSFVTSSSFFPSASSLSSSFDQASNMMMMMSAPSSQSSPLISPSFSTIADGKGGEKSTSSFNPSNPKSAPFSFSPPSASSSSPPSFSASSSAKGISLKNSPSSSSSSSSSSRVISALPGKIATIECRVSANPSQEISFYWTFNGTKIQSFPSSSSSSFLLSSPSMSSPPPAVAAASSSKSRSSVNSASFSLPLSAASSQLHLTSSSPSSRSSSSPSSSSPYNILNSSSTFSIPSPPITAPFNNPSLKQIKLPYHKDSTVQNIQQQSTFRDRDGGEGNVAETEKGLREEIERGLKEANFVEVTNGGLTSLLYFKPMNQATDFGLIACWASNSIGSQMSPCLFTLIPEVPGPNTAADEAAKGGGGGSNKNSRRSESNEKLVNSNELNTTIAVIIGLSSTLGVILAIILLMMLIRSRDEANSGNRPSSTTSTNGTIEQTIPLDQSMSSDFNSHHNNHHQIAPNENQQLLGNNPGQWSTMNNTHCQMMIANDANLWTLDNNHGMMDTRWIPDVCPNMTSAGIGNVWIQDMSHGYPMTSCDPLLGTPQLSSECSSAMKGDVNSLQLDPCSCHVTVLPGITSGVSNSSNTSGSPSLQMYKVTTI